MASLAYKVAMLYVPIYHITIHGRGKGRHVNINDLGVSFAQYSASKHPQLESFKRTLTSYDKS